jgi:hypothetical protein
MRILLTLVFALCTLCSTRADDKSDDKGPVGRYQLIYAVTETVSPTGKTENRRVMKIDTVTGRVWAYMDLTDSKGKNTEGFFPVNTLEP